MTLIKKTLSILILYGIPFARFATAAIDDDYFAISSYLGRRISTDLEEPEQSAKISGDLSQALAISWAYSRNQEGELFFSHSKQNLTRYGERNVSTELDISYLQFGGRVLFLDDSPFSANLGLGIGAALLNPSGGEYDKEIALSGNISGGLRQQLNRQWALRGDLRVYGTVLNSNSTFFCADGKCAMAVNGEIYLQTELMAGIEYKF